MFWIATLGSSTALFDFEGEGGPFDKNLFPDREIAACTHWVSRNKCRRLDLFHNVLNDASFPRAVECNDNEVWFRHGYFLDLELANVKPSTLDPAFPYYGVYSHGYLSEEDCFFASDELGLSPIYYSKEHDWLFVSNNPYLIKSYKQQLGFNVFPEPTLPIWHILGLTIESEHTGFEGIYQIRPWRYLIIDHTLNISFPSKKRLSFKGMSYSDVVDACVEELSSAMRLIASRHDGLEAQLTGGLDSRLVLAFILNNNCQNHFVFKTGGRLDNPDYRVASCLLRACPMMIPRVADTHSTRCR